MAKGLDDLSRMMREASDAFSSLDGEIATLSFDPSDQASVNAAIAEMEASITSKVGEFNENPIVQNVADQLKERYRDEILNRAEIHRIDNPESEELIGERMHPPEVKIDPATTRSLENTVNDLRRADQNGFDRHIKKLSSILHSPSLNAETERLAALVDLDSWIEAGRKTAGSFVGTAKLDWPHETEKELGLIIKLIDRFAQDSNASFQFSIDFYYKSNSISGNLGHMTEQMIVPFSRDYLQYLRDRAEPETQPLTTRQPKSSERKAFVVHGHDEYAREAVARFLEKIGFQAIILHEQANLGRTIIEKIEANSDVGFAVVLLTPDDEGGSKGGPYQARARQNVLLELGFFIGYLGRDRVCAIKRGDVEVPSDFAGVVYEPFDDGGAWKQALGRELQAAGFNIDWNIVHR